jgi:ATP-dependent protease ClpP protease subunit
MQDRITNFVVDNSNISKEDYTNLVMNTGELVMDVGTILDGQRAVDAGLIDSIGNLTDALDCLYEMIE